MRSYTVATVALTLDVGDKWLDNTLSHHRIEGVVQSRQGVKRRLTPAAVLTLHVALTLIRTLGLPLRRALEVATALSSTNGNAKVTLAYGVTMAVDLDSFSVWIAERLASAVEVTPVPRRGRPTVK